MQGRDGLTFESDFKNNFISQQAKAKANKSTYLQKQSRKHHLQNTKPQMCRNENK